MKKLQHDITTVKYMVNAVFYTLLAFMLGSMYVNMDPGVTAWPIGGLVLLMTYYAGSYVIKAGVHEKKGPA